MNEPININQQHASMNPQFNPMSMNSEASSDPFAPVDSQITQNNMSGNIVESSAGILEAEGLLAPVSTLDEPVKETILRDLNSIYTKLKVVLIPIDRATMEGAYANVTGETGGDTPSAQGFQQELNKLRDWDLWGPLLICLSLSVLLTMEADSASEKRSVFASVFVTMWVGSTVVTINTVLLGGTISFFQSLCVLGYCVFPLDVAAFVIVVFKHTPFLGRFWFRLLCVAAGFVWSTRASTVFIGQHIGVDRRALAVYPVFFFYTFLGWMILLI
mmetsp:Transcript_29559/g.35977  ORF Transcript_29559/g.35977 Transcript_29559/m.35977 type:complete len:273 (+) Transcript_29559:191-1009(+)|eukprot:CAMPEP_0194373486 /NCGR_PEP_ID=MMETSP0174-20130528/21963_1 /TAXON_ID=216777 /ORGANISM="Proboscia alata, Strain PI-D3" /LENGTH=272 /DNA_ID=CAMNT_0039152623 /DNA_START=209 /DNA_END=1027 /DNA_ORIENTATION=+